MIIINEIQSLWAKLKNKNNKYMPLCQISSLQRKIYIALSIGTVNSRFVRMCITRFTLLRFDEYLAKQFSFDCILHFIFK